MVVLVKLHLLPQQEGIKLHHLGQIMIQSLEIKIKILSSLIVMIYFYLKMNTQ